ncbi:MAG: glycosyltransferase family 4 protein [Candidatus Eisenbacteria bacterium]|uniref:Glycosyltransferase family 4 protein n=1 Tax=Eiseniibacteriota bacterium TaxID=2212470 RepID=A0A933SAJ7_UNCEI|nr:glycosyltransferase family 4 protein [Candidatus Eisenbacteria bacterium]
MTIHGVVDNDIFPARFGGSQRSFGLARGLARRHRVRMLCVVPNRSEGAADERVAGVELRRRKAWHTSLAWRLEQAKLAPLFAAEAGHRGNAARYAAALAAPPYGSAGGADGAEHPDVLTADLNVSAVLERAKAPLRVYTSHNVEYDRFTHAAPPVAMRASWASRLRAIEQRAVASADFTVVCTDDDAHRMRELYGAGAERFTVIPNGFDETELRAPLPGEREAARAALGFAPDEYVAVFVGADWGPNREALAVLTGRVMPALAGERVKLLVVGTVTRALAGRREPWLVAHGEAAAILPLLHAADAGVNPVLTGGGSNVKVPTYLAAGLAVVTTPFGVRGYAPLEPHVVVAETDDFADALRARPAGHAARAERAPEALGEYAWGRLGERLGEDMERRLRTAAGTKGAA